MSEEGGLGYEFLQEMRKNLGASGEVVSKKMMKDTK